MTDQKLYGWRGKVLWVDLAAKTSRDLDISDMCQDYLGARGFATKLAWDHMEPGTGAFDDGNLLMFFNGPCTGNNVPGVGRGYVFGVAPQGFPEHFTRSSVGGRWPNGLKECGYDGLVIENKSQDKVVLEIINGGVVFHDGSKYWGQDTQNTQYLLKDDFGSERSDSLVIGPAGENLLRFATIHTLFNNAAGQGGFGAVMGDKQVKGILFNGSIPVPVRDYKEIMDIRKEVLYVTQHEQGPYDDHAVIGGLNGLYIDAAEEKKKGNTSELTLGVNACSGCGLGGKACVNAPIVWGYKDVPATYGSESFSGVMKCNDQMLFGWPMSPGPDEKWQKEGNSGRNNRWPTSFKVGAEIGTMSNLYGINTWELSSFMMWFSELETLGIDVSEIIGMKYDVEDETLWQRIITKMVNREDFFGEMAEGVARLGEKLGSPYKEYSTHALNGYTDHALGTHSYFFLPYPMWVVPALLFATDDRDPISDSGHRYAELWGFNPVDGSYTNALDPIAKMLWGDEMAVGPKGNLRKINGGTMEDDEFDELAYSCKEQPAIQLQNRSVVTGSGVFCDGVFPRYMSFGSQKAIDGDVMGDWDLEAKVLTAVTGVEYTTPMIEQIGERIINLQRCLNVVTFNRDKAHDMTICDNIQPRGDFTSEKRIDKERFSDLLGRYYALRGWNENGIPSEEKLLELGLEDCNEKMKAYR